MKRVWSAVLALVMLVTIFTVNVNALTVWIPQKPSPTPVVIRFSTSKGISLVEHEKTTVYAAVNGGKAPYQYKFIVYNPTTGKWFKIRDFDKDRTAEWDTGAAGSKILYVDVKDAKGQVVRNELAVSVAKKGGFYVTKFKSTHGTIVDPYVNTLLTAEATGGKQPYKYKFIVHNITTDQWYRIQDFSEEHSIYWMTGGVGNKILYVDVKDTKGNVVREQIPVSVTSIK